MAQAVALEVDVRPGARGVQARIGMEDTLTLPDGSAADGNADLVAAAVRLLSR